MKKIIAYISISTLLLACGAANNQGRDGIGPRDGNNDRPAITDEVKFKKLERSMITRAIGVPRLTYAQVQDALIKKNLPELYPQFPSHTVRLPRAVEEVTEFRDDCGDSIDTKFTIEQRIKDCQDEDGISELFKNWYGKLNGISGEGNWRLVSYIDKKKVWIDDSTGLLWSDIIADQETFTNALGFTSEDEEEVSIESLCNGKDSATNPSLGKIPTPNVAWRLPNKQEVLQAYLNGASAVFSKTATISWSASFAGDNKAWAIDETSGAISQVETSEKLAVRCIGVVLDVVE